MKEITFNIFIEERHVVSVSILYIILLLDIYIVSPMHCILINIDNKHT